MAGKSQTQDSKGNATTDTKTAADLEPKAAELDTKAAELDAKAAALEKVKKDLEKREADINVREQLLEEKEEALMADVINEAESSLSEEEQETIAALCKEMNIAPEFVFSSNVDRQTGTVTVLTNGGARVRVAPGDEIPKLTEIQITGINPELAKRKPVAGKKR